MTANYLSGLITSHDAGRAVGITSVCSAHPVVLAATLLQGAATGLPVLIEATCNQVNQDGGYTGMRPADFRAAVEKIALAEGFDARLLILGGDHLGPNPWRHLPAADAMARAGVMVAEYAAAGFQKIHLDASMACGDDPSPLPVSTIADRAATLAAVAEAHGAGQRIVYVVGTEVPVPGGATEHVENLVITTPGDAAETIRLHHAAFVAKGIGHAVDRIVGLVVQPGVEFGHENVVQYDPAAALALSRARTGLGVVYEAHSTDYQSPDALAALVRDGFAILKVGPWLTFALREALYGLDMIASELTGRGPLKSGMEALMRDDPAHWQSHYHGSPEAMRLQRHFSYSDRIRYYWAAPRAQALVSDLMGLLGDRPIPETLISQYLHPVWQDVACGRTAAVAPALLRASVAQVLATYQRACLPEIG